MHSIVHFNPILAGIMLSIDFMLNILLIVYVRIEDLSKNSNGFFVSNLNLSVFINKYLFINELNYALNLFLVFGFFYFLAIFMSTNPKKPRRRRSAWKLNIMIIVLYSVHTCFSVLIITAQVVNILCSRGIDNFTCLSGSNVDSAIVSSLGIFANLLNSYFIENIYNFQFMGINGETGILSNQKSLTLLFPILKYFAVSIYFSTLSDAITSAMFIFVSLTYVLQLYLRFNQSYNFSKFLSEIEVTGVALLAYNYALCVMINAFNFQITNGDFFLAVALNFVVAGLVYALKKNSWNNKLNKNFLTITTIPGKEIYAYRMLECIMSNSFEDQLLLNGLVKTHKLNCNHSQCICSFEKMINGIKDDAHLDIILEYKKSLKSQKIEDYLEEDQKYIDSQVNSIVYQGSLEKIKSPQQLIYLNLLMNWLEISFKEQNQHRMRIIQAYILSEILQKDLKSLFLISTLGTKLTLQEKFAIFCYQKIIFDKVNKRIRNLNAQSLDIEQIQKSIVTEKKVQKLFYYMDNTIQHCTQFWKHIQNKDQELNFMKLHNISLLISKDSLQTEKYYREIRSSQPDYYNLILIYERFLRNVMNYENDALKEQSEFNIVIQRKRIQNLKSLDFKHDIFDLNKKIGIIVIKSSSRQLGKITLANQEMTNITQIENNELKNHNISILLPTVISESVHNKCLEQFFTHQTRSKFINQKQNLQIRDNNGFLILMDFLTQPFYDQIYGLQFIAYMKKTSSINIKGKNVKASNLFVVITDNQGYIKQSSRNFSYLLNFHSAQDLLNSDLSIYKLCSDIDKLMIEDENEASGIETYIYIQELMSQNNTLNGKINSEISCFSEEQSYVSNSQSQMSLSSYESKQKNQLQFIKQRSITALIKGDFRYLFDHQYLSYAVYYISVKQRLKMTRSLKNDLQIHSEGKLERLREDLLYEGSATNSGTSSSNNSSQLKQLQNMKSEFEIRKRPQVIGIFQKLFVVYFLIFVSLSSAIMYISYQNNNDFQQDISQFQKSRQIFYELVEVKNNLREYILLQNNKTNNDQTLLQNRTDLMRYLTEIKTQKIKELNNDISEYILNDANEDLEDYNYKLENDKLQLVSIDSKGNQQMSYFSFIPGIEQIIAKIQMIISQSQKNSTCFCLFKEQDFLINYNFSQQEKDYYFVDKNIIDVLGAKIWQSGNILLNLMNIKSNKISHTILFFAIPGMIISFLCSFAFFPVLISIINNRKQVIEMISRLRVSSAKIALYKIDKFNQDLDLNKQNQVNINQEYIFQPYNLETIQQQINEDDLLSPKSQHASEIDNERRRNDFQNNFYNEESLQQAQAEQNSNISYHITFMNDSNRMNEQFSKGKQNLIKDVAEIKIKKDEQTQIRKNFEEKLNKIIIDINSTFRNQKILHGFKILLASVVICMFFLALYFLNTEALNKTSQSLNVYEAVLGRGPCLSAVSLYTRQRIIQNRTVAVAFIESKIDSLYDYCLLNYNKIQQFRKEDTEIFQGQKDLINNIESKYLCELSSRIIQDDSYLDQQIKLGCDQALQGLLLSGMSQTYSYLISEFRKFQIQYESFNGNYSQQIQILIEPKFIMLSDISTFYLKPVIDDFNSQINSQLLNYYQYLTIRSLIFYILFIIFLFTAILLIIVYILKIIQREIYFNKKIIKFIPIEELQRNSISKILKRIKF